MSGISDNNGDECSQLLLKNECAALADIDERPITTTTTTLNQIISS